MSLRALPSRGAALALSALLAACAAASPSSTVIAPPRHTGAHPAPAGALALRDVVMVRAPSAPWLAGLYRVGLDGSVMLPRVGRVQAAGRTVEELARVLEQVPDAGAVSVTVHTRLGERVAVAGEVRHPGMVALAGSMTLARAIAAVGGTTAHAAEHRVEVLRVRGGRVERLRYSLPASGQAITLQPGDSVVVPTEANPFGEPPPPDDEVDLAVERSR